MSLLKMSQSQTALATNGVHDDPPLFAPKVGAQSPLTVLGEKIEAKKMTKAVAPAYGEGTVTMKVKNGIMYIYTKIGYVYVQLKVNVNDSYVAARDRAFKELTMLRSMIEGYKLKVQNGVILVKGRVTDAGVQIRAKAFGYHDALQVKVLDNYNKAKAALENLPVPVSVKKTYLVIHEKGTRFVVFVKGNMMFVYGTVSDACVRIKAKGVANIEAANKKAAALISRVMKLVNPYVDKINVGLTSMKGRVGSAVVSIKSNAINGKEITKAKVVELYARLRKTVGDSTVMKKLTEGCTFMHDKANSIAVYAKDGYVHMTSKVGDKILYVKAKVVKIKGKISLKIVEQYITTKNVVGELINTAQAAFKNTADKTKIALADKPIVGGATTGAVVLGTAGGATGGVVGLCAGAAFGVPLAVFTLGLSIPIGAAIGGGAGVAVGAAAGGTAGAAGGAAAGYGYEHMAQINSGVGDAISKVGSTGEALKKRIPRIGSWSSTGGTK